MLRDRLRWPCLIAAHVLANVYSGGERRGRRGEGIGGADLITVILRSHPRSLPPSFPPSFPPVLLGLMYLGSGRSTSGISAIQNRMGIFMLEMLFLAFTVRASPPSFLPPLAAFRVKLLLTLPPSLFIYFAVGERPSSFLAGAPPLRIRARQWLLWSWQLLHSQGKEGGRDGRRKGLMVEKHKCKSYVETSLC